MDDHQVLRLGSRHQCRQCRRSFLWLGGGKFLEWQLGTPMGYRLELHRLQDLQEFEWNRDQPKRLSYRVPVCRLRAVPRQLSDRLLSFGVLRLLVLRCVHRCWAQDVGHSTHLRRE